MNKKELIRKTAEQTGFSMRDTSLLLDAMLNIAADELSSGGSILLTGFGCLEAKTRGARKGAHPRTGEPISIPPVHTAVFRVGTKLQAILDHPKTESSDQ